LPANIDGDRKPFAGKPVPTIDSVRLFMRPLTHMAGQTENHTKFTIAPRTPITSNEISTETVKIFQRSPILPRINSAP
jgi:hypothetical protein